MKIGNIKTQQATMRGWLCGQFFPSQSPFHDLHLEMYCKKLPAGNPEDKLHTHPQGNEYMVVIEGKLRMQIDNEVLDLVAGEYIAIPQGTPEQILEVLEPTTIVGCHYPSVPNNKKFIS